MKLNSVWDEVLKDEFDKPYFKETMSLLEEEYKNYKIYPKKSDVFSAFRLTDYDKVKVLILGQDPYHGYNQAHGLAFSVKPGVKIPPSLVNIYKELNSDLGIEIPSTGYLKSWADSGIMLLNTTLTVREGSPMSHSKIGWEFFTDRVIEALDEKKEPMAFILWGSHARSKKRLLKNRDHLITEGPHPSPLSAYRGFFGSKPFSKVNEYFIEHGENPPDWRIKC